ncbi:MAG: Hpt domain-containing protein [Planctomycetota bacterium]
MKDRQPSPVDQVTDSDRLTGRLELTTGCRNAEQNPMTEPLQSDHGWNPERVLVSVDDCLVDLKNLLEIFLRETPRLLSDIRTAVENSEAQRLHLAAHTLRGSFQILCADDAELTAGAMETAGKHGKTAVAVTLLPKLEHELAMITLQVTTFLNTCAEC